MALNAWDCDTAYENECYECGHKWYSKYYNEPCPKCNESDNIGTDLIG